MVPKISCSLFASRNYDHCAYNCSLLPPPAAVAFIARAFRRSSSNFARLKTKKTPDWVSSLFWRRTRDSPLVVPKISCSLFASRNFDHCAYNCSLLPPPAAVAFIARAFRRSSSNFARLKTKKTPNWVSSLFWRRTRDSNSRAGYPTYSLSRGASSPLE